MADHKKVLVLSGGNVKGSYQAGAIKRLLDQGFQPDAVYGVSVGALNGALLADQMGQTPTPIWPDAGDNLVRFWIREVTSFSVVGRERTGAGIIWKAIRDKFSGLIDMTPIMELLERTLNMDNITNSPLKVYPGVVNLAKGNFFNADPVNDKDNFFKYIIASTREPINMDIVDIGEEAFVDGGLRNIAPLKPAIDGGAEEIIVIANQPEKISEQTGRNYRDLFTLARRTVGIMTNEIINNDLALAERINELCKHYGDAADGYKISDGPLKGARFVDIMVIRPKERLPINILNFDSHDINTLIDLGFKDAKEKLGTKTWP